jgi:hypothetical protein
MQKMIVHMVSVQQQQEALEKDAGIVFQIRVIFTAGNINKIKLGLTINILNANHKWLAFYF